MLIYVYKAKNQPDFAEKVVSSHLSDRMSSYFFPNL